MRLARIPTLAVAVVVGFAPALATAELAAPWQPSTIGPALAATSPPPVFGAPSLDTLENLLLAAQVELNPEQAKALREVAGTLDRLEKALQADLRNAGVFETPWPKGLVMSTEGCNGQGTCGGHYQSENYTEAWTAGGAYVDVENCQAGALVFNWAFGSNIRQCQVTVYNQVCVKGNCSDPMADSRIGETLPGFGFRSSSPADFYVGYNKTTFGPNGE